MCQSDSLGKWEDNDDRQIDFQKDYVGGLSEFQEFILKGNAFDLAVGVIIGAAFSGVVTSLVGDILMPPIGAFWAASTSPTTSPT